MHQATLIEGLGKRLNQMSEQLKAEAAAIPDKPALRRLITREIGQICSIADFPLETGVKLMGVDGSSAGFGGNSCRLDALAAMAVCTCGARVAVFDLVHSLDVECRALMERIAAEKNVPLDVAQEALVKARLAALECQACQELLRRNRDFAGAAGHERTLVLMDGGFLRYQTACPGEWGELVRFAEETEVLLSGVIEEIGTFHVARLVSCVLGLEWPRNDRELLFGLLDPGECILVRPELQFKGDYYTVFARFSDHPQPVAIDFLRSQLDEGLNRVKAAVRIMWGITPRSSRGFPLWLDMVDSEVHLTEADVEAVARHCLGADVVERLFLLSEG